MHWSLDTLPTELRPRVLSTRHAAGNKGNQTSGVELQAFYFILLFRRICVAKGITITIVLIFFGKICTFKECVSAYGLCGLAAPSIHFFFFLVQLYS